MRHGAIDILSRIAEQSVSSDGSTTANVFTSFSSAVRMKQLLAVLAKVLAQKKYAPNVRSILRALQVWDDKLLESAVATCSAETQSVLSAVLAPPKVGTAPAKPVPAVASVPAVLVHEPLPQHDDEDSTEETPSTIKPSVEVSTVSHQLTSAVARLVNTGSSIAEKSACLRTIASSLQLQGPALSPISTDTMRAEADVSGVLMLVHAVCETLQLPNATVRLLCCTVIRRAVRKYSGFITADVFQHLVSSCNSALQSCSREVRFYPSAIPARDGTLNLCAGVSCD